MIQELKNPPVKLYLFQIKFSRVDINVMFGADERLIREYPVRKKNIHVGLELDGSEIPLGKSKLNAKSDAKIESYIYMTKDQKDRVEVLEDTLTYVCEREYTGWDNFVGKVSGLLDIFGGILGNVRISRSSIRFVNRFVLSDFSDPEEYFTTVVSKDGGGIFPVRQYGFKIQYEVPDTNVYAIVNQSADSDIPGEYAYLLDIDVLDRQSIIFQKETIVGGLERLREIKNRIFFDSITEKTISLCN